MKRVLKFLFIFALFGLSACASNLERNFRAYDLCYGGFFSKEGEDEMVVCINNNREGIGRMGLYLNSSRPVSKPMSCAQFVDYQLTEKSLTVRGRRGHCPDGSIFFTSKMSCDMISNNEYRCSLSRAKHSFNIVLLEK